MKRLLLLLLPALLVLGACGGDKGNDVDTASSKKTTTTVAGADTTALEAGGSSTTVAGGAGKSTATTKKSGGSSAAPAPGPQPATAAGIKAAAPGTYASKITGTMTTCLSPTGQKVDTTASLKIEPLQGTDQKSSQSTPQGGQETVLRYQGDGVYLVSLKLTGAVTKEFVLAPPGLAFPQPAPAGKAWSWTAKSTDGKTTVKSDFKILRTETVQIGGEAVPTVVVETTVTTDGDLKSTSKGTMFVSEAYRLIVREDSKMNGTYSGCAFSSDTSSVLQSTKPS